MEHPIEVNNLSKSFALTNKLRIRDVVRRRYETVLVLDDISLTVRHGEILGVMGKNGAGKSTLLRILGGVYQPSAGMVVVRGEVSAIFEMGTFMSIYQTGRNYCRDYLDFYAPGLPDKAAVIEEIKAFCELGDYFERPIHTYSSGMQAKLLFSAATSLPVDIFLVDEALVVGDEYFQGKAYARMRALLEGGAGGVIVSHYWVDILRMCSRAILLENHRITYEGPALGLVQRYLDIEDVRSDDIYIVDEQRLDGTLFTARTGEPFLFSFTVAVERPPVEGLLDVVFFIEYYTPGEGWGIITIADKVMKVTAPGRYDVDVCLKKIPLMPGDYYIALELALPLKPGEKAYSLCYRKKNWLLGNALRLRVEGERTGDALLKGQVEWAT